MENNIRNLISEIEEQIKFVNGLDSNEVDEVIPDEQKSDLILKQAEIINSYIKRDDEIARLQEQLNKAMEDAATYKRLYGAEHERTKILKRTIEAVASALAE